MRMVVFGLITSVSGPILDVHSPTFCGDLLDVVIILDPSPTQKNGCRLSIPHKDVTTMLTGLSSISSSTQVISS